MKIKLLTILLLVTITGMSQILFHPFIPEIYQKVEEWDGDSTRWVYLDLNADSVEDLRINLKYQSCFATPSADECFSSSAYNISGISEFIAYNDACSIDGLSAGDTIWNNSEYTSAGSMMMRNPEALIACNHFSSYKYIGLKLHESDTVFYGWIKMKTSISLQGAFGNSYAELWIREMALNSEPGCGVIAGDTLTSLCSMTATDEFFAGQLVVFPNPVSDYFRIHQLPDGAIVSLYNVFGKRVRDFPVSGNNARRFSAAGLKNGIYLLVIENSKQTLTVKMIITR